MGQRDPHDVLGVPRNASQVMVKAAWRRLAREHHPDLAGDSAARRDATRRMAEINAAYQALRSAPGGRAGTAGHDGAGGGASGAGASGSGASGTAGPGAAHPAGPPPPPPTRPVTARLDTTDLFRQRNATTTPAGGGYRHRPRVAGGLKRATWGQPEQPRASDPTGPLQRVRSRRAVRRPLPDLDAALATQISFGKFHGRTLAEIARLEPSYLVWVERTITRDPDLVAAARVVLDEGERRAAGGGASESGSAVDGTAGSGEGSRPDGSGDAAARPREGVARGSAG
ncbi:MAG: DnaJ domain-containing protein [Candidatus Limnocylindrales bacterium]|jgi:hypothetical protein|nr:DnaJ domain-containing protein [Candidatus Limnocylindrales bacterium]